MFEPEVWTSAYQFQYQFNGFEQYEPVWNSLYPIESVLTSLNKVLLLWTSLTSLLLARINPSPALGTAANNLTPCITTGKIKDPPI